EDDPQRRRRTRGTRRQNQLEAIDGRLVDDRPATRDPLEDLRKSCDQKLEGVVETPTTTVRLMRFDRLCFDLPRSSLSARFQHPEDLRERIDGQEATELGLQPAGCIARLTALPVADIVERQART